MMLASFLFEVSGWAGSAQTGSNGNNNFTSRVPGYGQPCNLSPSAMVAAYGANYTLAECQAVP